MLLSMKPATAACPLLLMQCKLVMQDKLVITPRLLRLKAAEQYVGGQRNLKALGKAGWVKPLIQLNANTTFDVRALDLAVYKATLDGWPEPAKK